MDTVETVEVLREAFTYNCPVCFEKILPPIYQCCNGHIICTNCSERVDICVECRVPISKSSRIRNVALDRIMNNLCVDCPNKSEGCEVKITVEFIKTHLQGCAFTPFNLCSNLLGRKNCSFQVNDSTVLVHLDESHRTTTVNHNTFRLCLNLSKYPMGESDCFFEPLVVTSMEVPLLIQTLVSMDGYFTVMGITLKNNKNLRDIRVKFRIESQTKKTSFEWSGSVQPYRETKVVNSFRIPITSLLEFLGSNASPKQIRAININVFVWESTNLSQDDKIHEEVHIFEQSITDSEIIHSSQGRSDSANAVPLTATNSGLQSVHVPGTASCDVNLIATISELQQSVNSQDSEGDFLDFFSSPLPWE